MKLTPEQIDRLYQFTRQHYVEFYDLQTELVDHLANAIEVQWKQNPKLDFEEALQTEFKKFGVFGFMEVVEQRQAALNKKYNVIVWQHLKRFFTLPVVLATFSVTGILFYVLNYFNNQAGIVINSLTFFALLTFWSVTIYKRRELKKRANLEGKKWLFREIILGYGTFVGLSYIPWQILVHNNLDSQLGIPKTVFFSVFIVLLYLLEYIVLFEIPSKAEDYLKETYPEYEIV